MSDIPLTGRSNSQFEIIFKRNHIFVTRFTFCGVALKLPPCLAPFVTRGRGRGRYATQSTGEAVEVLPDRTRESRRRARSQYAESAPTNTSPHPRHPHCSPRRI